MNWHNFVLQFWFHQLRERDWWEKNPLVDQAVVNRFGPLHDRLSREASPHGFVTVHEALAAVIVLDQFSRHIHRGNGRAFAADPLALRLATRVVDDGFDVQADPRHRRFFYLPFEHSEDKAVQARSVRLFGSLGDDENLDYAIRHKVIIDRFGRFPHRNMALGRRSTPEEIAFLKTPGSSF